MNEKRNQTFQIISGVLAILQALFYLMLSVIGVGLTYIGDPVNHSVETKFQGVTWSINLFYFVTIFAVIYIMVSILWLNRKKSAGFFLAILSGIPMVLFLVANILNQYSTFKTDWSFYLLFTSPLLICSIPVMVFVLLTLLAKAKHISADPSENISLHSNNNQNGNRISSGILYIFLLAEFVLSGGYSSVFESIKAITPYWPRQLLGIIVGFVLLTYLLIGLFHFLKKQWANITVFAISSIFFIGSISLLINNIVYQLKNKFLFYPMPYLFVYPLMIILSSSTMTLAGLTIFGKNKTTKQVIEQAAE